MDRILLSGASSFLGQYLYSQLRGQYDIVRIFRSPVSDYRVDYDVLWDYSQANEQLVQYNNIDFVINCICDYGRVTDDWSNLVSANLLNPIKLLEQIRVQHGKITYINIGTALPPETSKYSFTKDFFSSFLKNFHQTYSINVVDLKLHYFMAFREYEDDFLSKMILAMMKNTKNIALTDGLQRRDFIDISDVISAIKTIMNNRKKLHGYNSIDVGSGTTHRLNTVLSRIKEITNSRTVLDFGAVSKRELEPEILRANTKILNSLGWKPRYTLEASLDKMVEEAKK